jgi:diguanylate cyclase (GGDEF)-like protein
MLRFKNYSIKLKLIIIFIVFKVLPLILLAAIGIFSFLKIDKLLEQSSKNIIKQTQSSIQNTTKTAILDSIDALDKKSQSVLEDKSVMIANEVADFLKNIDKDIIFLSKLEINNKTIQSFYAQKMGEVFVPSKYTYNEITNKWVTDADQRVKISTQTAQLKDNSREFHKIVKKNIRKKLIPLYKEISFYKPDGKEIYKISSLDSNLKNISKRYNTYLHAERYFKEAKNLKEGEIYVSKVIGEYIPSLIIGSYTKPKAQTKGIAFEPQKSAYAGKENPLGKKFSAIIRFVTPVYKDSKLQGYLTLALDHQHIMDFTDFKNPLSPDSLNISDASNGNYAFMWSSDFECISHPRDYFIVGYDAKTGKKVPGWIDSSLAKKFEQSGKKELSSFLKKQPIFLKQSLSKKPNIKQIKIGQLGLDCKYLNFAPQCQGWSQLVDDGGYGSFIIYWSKVWKLTTAATIPYYTGQYGLSKRGFGFVTIGANVDEFHSAAIKTKKEIEKVLHQENKNVEKSINSISKNILDTIKSQINKMMIITVILIILVIYIAIFVANYLSKRINKIIVGTQKIKDKNLDYQIEYDSEDELGELSRSFNDMAQAINKLNKGLEKKLFTDELSQLGNRNALYEAIKKNKLGTLILVDIDSFKNINDHYGISAGNFVLKEFSELLSNFVLEYGLSLYRIGSDEFVLLKSEKLKNDEIDKIIDSLNQLISSAHFKNNNLQVDTTVSFACGVSIGERNLVEHADLALNEAKDKKLLYLIYNPNNPNMNKHTEYILWREKIQYAIKNDNFVPFFQPIVDINNPENKKYECLIRMIDNGNVISPYMFLDIAKESKLYSKLTRIMIKKSFSIFQNIDATFSINISVDDIEDKQTVAYINRYLEKYDVKDKLIFEILESEEIDDFNTILSFIEQMKSKGVRFAIDDFGSGYSNFSYMLQIKPDFIKIDGSLIRNISSDSNSYYVVDAIVKFAKSLDIKLIAEYVSTKEILDTLHQFDIDYMQGYYFSEPQETL